MNELHAWLRMSKVSGGFSIPTSEDSYCKHRPLIDAALPLNGGNLQADGSWAQQAWKIDTAFAQTLREMAFAANQLYMPGVNNDRAGIQTVLSNTDLQVKAAQNLVAIAQERYDAPWDGVYLDLEGIPLDFQTQLTNFLHLIAYHVHKADLLLGVSVRGRTDDAGPDYDSAYTYDFQTVAQVADLVDLRCYGFWAPVTSWMQRSLGPHWWIEKCIIHALNCGIPAQRITLGLGCYSMFSPESSSGHGRLSITHESALELAAEHEAKIEWIERDDNGLVREQFADIGAGHVWIHSGDTHRHGLDLAAKYQLRGTTLFVPGMEDDYLWEVLDE